MRMFCLRLCVCVCVCVCVRLVDNSVGLIYCLCLRVCAYVLLPCLLNLAKIKWQQQFWHMFNVSASIYGCTHFVSVSATVAVYLRICVQSVLRVASVCAVRALPQSICAWHASLKLPESEDENDEDEDEACHPASWLVCCCCCCCGRLSCSISICRWCQKFTLFFGFLFIYFPTFLFASFFFARSSCCKYLQIEKRKMYLWYV